MTDITRPSRAALREARDLSTSLLQNIELSELNLEALCLKASRLARLLNDDTMQQVFAYEAGGYPSSPAGIPSHIYEFAQIAGREYQKKEEKTGKMKCYAFVQSVGELEASLAASKAALDVARDPDVSISSANPYQHVNAPWGNAVQRQQLQNSIASIAGKISSRRALLHRYATEKNYELKFSQISSDIFSRSRLRVDAIIQQYVPNAANKLTAAYDNLQSENNEDWSNAVHSCRRVLQDLANALFPATVDREIEKTAGKLR